MFNKLNEIISDKLFTAAYVFLNDVEAVYFVRFRFHYNMTASTTSASTSPLCKLFYVCVWIAFKDRLLP